MLVFVIDWQMHVESFLQKWRDTNLIWLDFPNRGCLHVTSYKNLKTMLKEELIAIGRFFNVEKKYLTGDHLECVLNNHMGLFKRPKHSIPKDIFTQEMNELMVLYRKEVEMKLRMVSKQVSF